MNKQELLNDLASKEWCDGLNGGPELQETKADGGRWYLQNMREVQVGEVCIYRNIHFYVVGEGSKSEKAYYKDAVPDSITNNPKGFPEKVKTFVRERGNTKMEGLDNEAEFAILTEYVDGKNGVTEKRLYAKEVEGAMVAKDII